MKKCTAKTNSALLKFIFGNLLIFGLIIILGAEANAQGNLLITPRRVVFEGNKRTQDLNLANTGADSARYNVSIVQYRMREDGSFEEITTPDPGQNFADKYIRFFPRSILLGPNEAQVVKMQLTRTEGLAPGEYRSHVYFRAVPRESALGMQGAKKDTVSIGVQLIPIFGITIPVIIKIGESNTKTNLSDLRLEMVNDTTNKLHMAFNRTGNMSVYGISRWIIYLRRGNQFRLEP
jgi:P pilus assembly chaperone PapD